MLELQILIYGDRGAFVFIPKSENEIDIKEGVNLLNEFAQNGYGFKNFSSLLKSPKEFENEFELLIKNFTKEGLIFRTSFGNSEELKAYTQEEYKAILALYSVSYGWSDEYSMIFNTNPSDILLNYLSNPLFKEKFVMPTLTKTIEIWGEAELENLIIELISLKAPLRKQQIDILKYYGKYFKENLAKVANKNIENIVLKETLILIASLTKGAKENFLAFKTIKDILRYIAFHYTKNSLYGQITKNQLKNASFRLKTSDKTFIKNQIELLAQKKGIKALLEDMFPNEKFWRGISKVLFVKKSDKERRRYPNYYSLIDVLYDNSYKRDWSFYSKYTTALQNRRYDKAIEIASSRIGFLFRNLIVFLRFVKGVKLSKEIRHYGFQNINTILFSIFDNKKSQIVEYDATSFFESKEFDILLDKNINTKLGYQLLYEIEKEIYNYPIVTRKVQGITKKYNPPLPAIDKKLKTLVSNKLKAAIIKIKKEDNKDLGKVYIDKNVILPIQFSGRSENSIMLSGGFLPRFSKIPIEELIQKKLKKPILRVGIMWKSKSTKTYIDLDHSLFVDEHLLYYGKPELYNKNGQLIAVSSGDFTYCPPEHSDKFSAEFVDIDLELAKKSNFKSIVNIVNNYNGEGLNQASLYFFVSFIEKNKRITKGQSIEIALDKVDYAIDVASSEYNGFFGIHIALKEMLMTILNKESIKIESGNGLNITNFIDELQDVLLEAKEAPSLIDTLKEVVDITDNISEADKIISYNIKDKKIKDTAVLLHPMRDLEKINSMVF